MLQSVVRTFILDFCLEVFFKKVTRNLVMAPLIQNGNQNEVEITHFMAKHYNDYIDYIDEEEDGFMDLETFINFLDSKALTPPTDDLEFLFGCFETMAQIELLDEDEYWGDDEDWDFDDDSFDSELEPR